MSNLISRQAAIDALNQIFDRCEEIEAHLPEGDSDRIGYKMYPDYITVWKYLHQLPSAQSEQRWIPVSERLPSYGEDVLLSIDGQFCAVGYIVQTNDERWHEWYYHGWYHPYEDVTAWMPLPKPWRGEEDGELV